jgi:hypothetical protein
VFLPLGADPSSLPYCGFEFQAIPERPTDYTLLLRSLEPTFTTLDDEGGSETDEGEAVASQVLNATTLISYDFYSG